MDDATAGLCTGKSLLSGADETKLGSRILRASSLVTTNPKTDANSTAPDIMFLRRCRGTGSHARRAECVS